MTTERNLKAVKVEAPPPFENGATLLDEVEDAFRRYVVLPGDHNYVVAVLWAVATHGIESWAFAPRLAIVSPAKRCGKTRYLEVTEHLSSNPMETVNASAAAMFRSISRNPPPTLFVDEADTIFGTRRSAENHEDLRGILNAGHRRGAMVYRCGNDQKVRGFSTFAMAAIAGIRDLPDTIMDCAVVQRMRRRVNGEQVAALRHLRDVEGYLWPLRDRIVDWMAGQEFPEQVENMPIEDRAADTWEPLVAVADAAGGDWPERARLAAKTMTDEEDTVGEESFGLELLRNIREVFQEVGCDKAHTEDLRMALIEHSEWPWTNYQGHGLTVYDMGKLLKPYRVHPRDIKLNGVGKKGYRLDGKINPKTGAVEGGLSDAWDRYLPVAVGEDVVADE